MISIGHEIYYGNTANKYGFSGFDINVDPSMQINAGGGTAVTSVWFVFESLQGVHIPIGNQGNFNTLREWQLQQVSDNQGRRYMAHVNNMSGYIGLNIGSKYSLGVVRNVNATKPFTDALAAEILAKFPIGMTPTRCFMTRQAALGLQKSRSAIGNWKADRKGAEAFSPLPEEVLGIPIVRTDSIKDDETPVSFA